MLKEFDKLPTSKEAKDMCDGDYIYCYINMLLDDEENEDSEFEVNANFDIKKFSLPGYDTRC